MRKISTFLTLCLVTVVGAFAQNPITKLSQVDVKKAYTIVAGRAGVLASQDGNALVSSKKPTEVAFNKDDAYQQFAFVKSPDEDKYYLYNVGAKKFVGKKTGNGDQPATMSDLPKDPIQIKDWDDATNKISQPYFDTSNYFCISNQGATVLSTWSQGGNGDAGVNFKIVEAAAFDPTEALKAFESKVTYKVMLNGTQVASTDVVTEKNGQAAELPAEWKRDFCTYSYSPANISSDVNEVTVTVAFASPITLSDSYETATWYNFATRNATKYWSTAGSVPYVMPTTKGLTNDAWAISGNPYTGFTIWNKAFASNFALGYDNTNNNGNVVMKEGASANWSIYKSGNGFEIGAKDLRNCLVNDNSGLRFWNSSSSPGDAGNLIVATEWVEDAYNLYLTNIKPILEAVNGTSFFTLKSAIKSQIEAYNAEATQSLTTANYNAMKALVDNAANYILPETGFYRIKASRTNRYITANSNARLVTPAQAVDQSNDLGTIFMLTKNGDNSYKIEIQGKQVNRPTTYNTAQPLGDADVTYTFELNKAQAAKAAVNTGKSLGSTGAGQAQYWHEDGSNRIVIWDASAGANASYFTFEAVSSMDVALNDVAGTTYATTYLPFNATIEGADAFALATQTGTSTLAETPLTGVIAKGTPMLLRGTANTATIKPTTQAATATADKNSLVGQYLAATAPFAETDYTLGVLDGKAGFYHWTGTLGANKAYIPGNASSTRGFIIGGNTTGIDKVEKANATTAIFDLQGRKVAKAQSGIYIVNGKKVFVK